MCSFRHLLLADCLPSRFLQSFQLKAELLSRVKKLYIIIIIGKFDPGFEGRGEDTSLKRAVYNA